jgi:hypothetical protein
VLDLQRVLGLRDLAVIRSHQIPSLLGAPQFGHLIPALDDTPHHSHFTALRGAITCALAACQAILR